MDMTEFEEKVNKLIENGFLVRIKTKNKSYLISEYIAYIDFVDLYYGEGSDFSKLEFLGGIKYSDIIGIRRVNKNGIS